MSIRTWSAVALGVAVVLLASIAIWNHVVLTRPVDTVTSADPRNVGVEVAVRFENYVDARTLIVDLHEVSHHKSPMDVFRVLLQVAAALKRNEFSRVILAHDGEPRFLLNGAYFTQLGVEYGSQNPIYTMRTFPSHVFSLDGTAAYSSWSGGLLGVTMRQMDDFADFHKRWYLGKLVEAGPSPQAVTDSRSDATAAEATGGGESRIATPHTVPKPTSSNADLPAQEERSAAPRTRMPQQATLETTASIAQARAQVARSTAKYYIDDTTRSYHAATCALADPQRMQLVMRSIVLLNDYSAHDCVNGK